MKCELLSEQNLTLMPDFIDDENTKYDEAVLKAFLKEKNAYGYIASDNGKAVGFAYGYVLNEPDGQKVYYLHAIDVMEGWQNQGYGTELVRFVHEHSKALGACGNNPRLSHNPALRPNRPGRARPFLPAHRHCLS